MMIDNDFDGVYDLEFEAVPYGGGNPHTVKSYIGKTREECLDIIGYKWDELNEECKADYPNCYLVMTMLES